ncbi:hypothetical protein SPACI_050210 [Sporomusa acidovorans DSM 3132]|uniref:TonB C-terminal domain-containing protein n=2 Tax=Sporomusa TaxID=2375 RepID=A0ABZ3J9V0_SPOA4|nr:gram-negative bacterial tonB protein [Sporomusa acidovorans DSM 3132]SDF46039.1 TonB protein C-terminal [Sporomusa acidovorans]
MTQAAYWPRAFGISCIIHFMLILLLGLLAGNLPVRQSPEEYIVVDLSLIGGSKGGAGGEPVHSAEKAAGLPAVPGIFSQAINQSMEPEPMRNFSTNELQTTNMPQAGSDSAGEAMPAAIGGNAAGISRGDGTAISAEPGTGRNAGSGSGASIGLGSGEGAAPDIDGAILAFLAEVEKHKEYPYVARKRGYEGVVTVFVELSAGGELRQVRVEKSSGFSLLDEAATAVVRRVSPFRHGLGRPVAMKIPISYHLLP